MKWRKQGNNYIAPRSAHYCDLCLKWHEEVVIERFSDGRYHVRNGPHYRKGHQTVEEAARYFHEEIRPQITQWRNR